MASLDSAQGHVERRTISSPADVSARAIVVGASSSELRRVLGPTPWTVLEEMVRHSQGPVDDCTAQVSIRSLAAALGLAKDTVARAVTRLCASGVVVAMQSRAATGAFDAAAYRIIVPADVLTIVPAANDQPTRARLARLDTIQLSLAIGS
jgi:hypothetical protein